MTTFNRNILLPPFTDILQRRPKDVALNNSPVNAYTYQSSQLTLQGKYLEGDCTLYDSANRLTFSNIQQSGTFESTTITADVIASYGSEDENITIYGYTQGQDGNTTARFQVDNCLNILAPPEIYNIQVNTNLKYYEAQKFTFSVSSNVTQIRMYNQYIGNHYSDDMEFVYTFPYAGQYVVSFFAITADGRQSQAFNINLTVPQRPYTTGCLINYANPVMYGGIAFYDCYVYSGGYNVVSPFDGSYIPYMIIEVESGKTGYIYLTYSNNQGVLNVPITSYGINWSGNYSGISLNPSTINTFTLSAYGSTTRTFYLDYWPVGQYGCMGWGMAIAFDVLVRSYQVVTAVTSASSSTSSGLAYPTTAINWSNTPCYGTLVDTTTYTSLNTTAFIVNANY